MKLFLSIQYAWKRHTFHASAFSVCSLFQPVHQDFSSPLRGTSPACSVPSTVGPRARVPWTAFAAMDTIAPTLIRSRCLAQVRLFFIFFPNAFFFWWTLKPLSFTEYVDVNSYSLVSDMNSLLFFFVACISHPQAEEPWDQRMMVVHTALNRETLSEPSLTQIYCWHAQSVSVHRADPADKARLAFLYIT